MEFLDFQAGPLQNDVYGKLFYYLRDTLVRFQEESKRLSIMVGLTSVDIPMSLHRVPEPLMYDRIHVSLFQNRAPSKLTDVTRWEIYGIFTLRAV